MKTSETVPPEEMKGILEQLSSDSDADVTKLSRKVNKKVSSDKLFKDATLIKKKSQAPKKTHETAKEVKMADTAHKEVAAPRKADGAPRHSDMAPKQADTAPKQADTALK